MPQIQSIEEILQYLKTQSELRSPENDEAGVLLMVRLNLIEQLTALDEGYFSLLEEV